MREDAIRVAKRCPVCNQSALSASTWFGLILPCGCRSMRCCGRLLSARIPADAKVRTE